MSTASSIAQFMALLSGGVNPSMLRNGLNGTTLTDGQNNVVDFQSLLGGTQTTAQSPGPVGIQMEQLIARAGGLSQEALESLKSLSNGEASSAAIWQFIRQQASVEGENAIVLNLSGKGVPQDVIEELQQLFSRNDLVTVLRDPKLSVQLDNALKDTDIETIEAPELASVIHAILDQNKGDIANHISFKPDADAPVEALIEALVRDGYVEQAVETPVRFVSNDTQPVALTLIQQKLAGDSVAPQEMALTAGKASPFVTLKGHSSANKGDGDLPLPLGNGQAINTPGMARAAQASESIADRLAGIINNAGTANSTSLGGLDFASMMFSADGESLLDADGNFVMPFEAGFKTASQAANPVLMQQSATQAHPSSQMVALSLTKMASKAANGEESQTYRLKLDPPEMGRIDIEMDVIEQTGHLKAVIRAEKPEALGLLQRDMHVLLKAMQDAGFENMSQQDFTFTLSQEQDHWADNGGRGSQSGFGSPQGDTSDGVDVMEMTIESEMTVIVDPVTGQRHVNMVV